MPQRSDGRDAPDAPGRDDLNLRGPTLVAAVAAAVALAAQARADVIDFWLNQPECTGGCGSGTAPPLIPNSSAVEVIVTTTTGSVGDFTGATVEFVAPTGNVDTPALINVNGSFSATDSIAGGVVIGPANEDHFGTMDAETGAVEAPTVTFTLTATSGNFWTDAADVLTPTTNFGAAYSHGFEAVTAAQNAGYYTAPAPSIGHGLPRILAVAGVLFGAWLMNRGKKRGFFGVPYPG